MTPRHRSSATPLALAMAVLVLYASLYPFTGWHWPAGFPVAALLALPWPPWLTPLDEALNLAGYVPLGLLVFIALVRSGVGPAPALAMTLTAGSMLSYGAEVLQHLLPGRHPSLKDWLMNTLGTLGGALLGALLHLSGALRRWQQVRQRWFSRHSAGALALLALWPLGMLFPTPVPWGLGQVGHRLREAAYEALDGVPWAQDLAASLQPPVTLVPLGHLAERVASLLGLLAPILLAYAVTRPGLHRLLLAVGALALGFVAMTLSTLLNFGPGHAGAWLTPAATVAAGGTALLSLVMLPLSQRLVLGLALVAVSDGVALVSQAPTDPYFAQNLQAWEQGRFVHFHGLAQWIGWLWPFAVIAWLLGRLSARDGGPD